MESFQWKYIHLFNQVFYYVTLPISTAEHWDRDKMADIFQCIIFDEHFSIAIKRSLEFVLKGPSSTIPALVQIMVWRRPGDKSLSEQMMVHLPTHICGTRPQWVNNWHQTLKEEWGILMLYTLHLISSCFDIFLIVWHQRRLQGDFLALICY